MIFSLILFRILFPRIILQHGAGKKVGIFDVGVAVKIIFVKSHAGVEKVFDFFEGFLFDLWGREEPCINGEHNGKVIQERDFEAGGNYTVSDSKAGTNKFKVDCYIIREFLDWFEIAQHAYIVGCCISEAAD